MKYSEGRNGIGRRGTDPMSVAMLKIEGPRDNWRNETGGGSGKDTSVVLLREYLRFDLAAYRYRGA